MVYEYSIIILFYCFANKLILSTKKINDMMTNDNSYQTIPLNNSYLNFLRKWEMFLGLLWDINHSIDEQINHPEITWPIRRSVIGPCCVV